jgi:hypothetical protein
MLPNIGLANRRAAIAMRPDARHSGYRVNQMSMSRNFGWHLRSERAMMRAFGEEAGTRLHS